MNEEENFPNHLIKKASKIGNEYAWKFTDIEEVIEVARKLKFGVLGGQVQYRFRDGTCELYWINNDPSPILSNENWETYVQRSCDEFIKSFKTSIFPLDIEKEALEKFSFLQDKQKQGYNLEDYKYFVLYFEKSL